MGEANQRGTQADRKEQAVNKAFEEAEIVMCISSPDQKSVNIKFLPRDEEPNQDSPAVILASYLNANMAELVVDAVTTKREYDAAIAAGKSNQEAANAPALRLAEAPGRSILTADGNIARRTDDVELILPPGVRREEPEAPAAVSGQGGDFGGGGASGSFESSSSESGNSSDSGSSSGGD